MGPPEGIAMKPAARLILTLAVALAGLLSLPAGVLPDEPQTVSVIVQAADYETAAAHVTKVGGAITHELKIIKAVVCDLTQEQREALEKMPRDCSYVCANFPEWARRVAE